LMEKWGGIVRRHVAVKSTAVDTLQRQFSGAVGPCCLVSVDWLLNFFDAKGYGSNYAVVARCLERAQVREPLESWDNTTIDKVVEAFTDEKFPTVIALNKMDHPDADKNIAKISRKYSEVVLTSAITEVFLRRLAKQNYINYVEGTDVLETKDDLPDSALKPLDEKLRNRIENVRDMVLYRFGSTGVVQVLKRAAALLHLVPVYPVRNVHTFASGGDNVSSGAVFRDCLLVKRGTTVGIVARKVMGEIKVAYIEGVKGVRVSEDDTVQEGRNDILSFKLAVQGAGA